MTMWNWETLKGLLKKRQGLDVSKLGAVMWPVAYPDMGRPEYRPDNPHITVIYFGDVTGDIGFTVEDVIAAVKKATVGSGEFLWVSVQGLEWFGPEQNIPVLRVNHSYLDEFHSKLKDILESRGIDFDTTYSEYKPHVTITNQAALDEVTPSRLLAGPVEVWWKGHHYRLDGNTLA